VGADPQPPSGCSWGLRHYAGVAMQDSGSGLPRSPHLGTSVSKGDSVSPVATDQRYDCYERLVAGKLATVLVLEKGKPVARLGRKA
jgi:hypothetical protein